MIRLVVVIVSSTIALWACGPCSSGPRDVIFLLHDPDPATQQLIDRCVDPPHTCLPLCEKLVGATGGDTIVHCEIHPQTDPAYVQVHVGLASHPVCPG